MKKKTHRLVILLMLAVLLTGCFTHVAMADRGPKPSVDLKVVNAPQGDYFIALLERGRSAQEKKNSQLHLYGSVYKGSVESYLNSFWYDGYDYWKVSGRCQESNENNTFHFRCDARSGGPRLIVIELDGTVTLSEPIRGEKRRSNYTYDFATGKVTEDIPSKEAYIYICCCLLTILIELAVLWAFRFPLTGKYENTLAVIIVNTVTNLPFTFYVLNAKSSRLWVRIVLFEVGIMVVECLVYSFVLRNKEGKRDYKRSIAYGVVANVVSALTMFLPF